MELSKNCWYHKNLASTKTQCADSTEDFDCQRTCTTYARLNKMYTASKLPDNFWVNEPVKPLPEDLNAWKILNDIRSKIKSFVDTHQNLYLHSQRTGNGKSLWASRLMKSYIQQLVEAEVYNHSAVRYIHVPELVSKYEILEKYSYDDDERIRFFEGIQILYESDLVCWDDFPFINNTKCETTVINSIIYSRLNRGLSNIYISSKNVIQLPTVISKNLSDKILESSHIVEFISSDFRKP